MSVATEPPPTAGGERAVVFGPYRLLAAQRLLLEGDKPVRLGNRAFDILAALVERAGEVVGKEELIARAWPQTFVEEANLKIQVSALRRALGDGQGGHRYVVTVTGRGYNFVAPVNLEAPSRASPPPTVARAVPHNLPVAVTRMIGREEAVAAILSRLSRQRLVTVVGPGGIGKTTVALAVAERVIASHEHGVWLVDLASLADPRLVPTAIATLLGLEIGTEDPLPTLVAALRNNRMLLLLDNCEHVIDAVATLAAAVLSGTSDIKIVATSREPLGVLGERQYRLGPLGSPDASATLTAGEAAAFPAVQLFVERVTAVVEDFALTDANAPFVVKTCRRLDGLPLAIEFAAPRVAVLGVEGLAAGLDHSLPLLTAGRRTALPRHRTMRAVVDWSYGLLSEDEQRLFRALGIFAGGFTVEAAAAVAMDATTTGVDAIDRLADLVAKSLVVVDVSSAKPRFRLLETVRAYAFEKLQENSDVERASRRHAEFFHDLLTPEGRVSVWEPTWEDVTSYSREIDNIRAALDWCFSSTGDRTMGAAITAAFLPVWLYLTLLTECRKCAETALAHLGNEPNPDARLRMLLLIGRGITLNHTGGRRDEAASVLTEGLRTAEALGDTISQMYALWGLWVTHGYKGNYRDTEPVAEKFCRLAAETTDPIRGFLADRLMGTTMFHRGNQAQARRHLDRAVDLHRRSLGRPQAAWFGYDLTDFTQSTLVRVLGVQGFLDQARDLAQSCIDRTQLASQKVGLCYVLVEAACPLALAINDMDAATQYVTLLIKTAEAIDLNYWKIMARCLESTLLISQGDYETGVRTLRASLDAGDRTGGAQRYAMFLSVVAQGLAGLGRTEEAHVALDQALDRADHDGDEWCIPDLLCKKGELALREAGSSSGRTATADRCFREAMELAQRQGALFWELGGATHLARLRLEQNRPNDARQILAPVYGRFVEGFETPELRAAKRLLDFLETGRSSP